MARAHPHSRLTAVFSKRPEPGAVKTRLCPPLSAAQAARLAQAMLDDTVAKLAPSRAFETALIVAPAESVEWFRARYPGVARIEAQAGTGLGERLARCFAAERARVPGRTVVVVGSDAPLLPLATIVAAHAALERGVELALALDGGGGYALVGSNADAPEVFTSVAMSTGDMAARTLAVAHARGLRVELLEPCSDVDVPADLERLARELAALDPASPGFPRETARVLRELRP